MSASQRQVPDFLIIGSMKSGTTSLYDTLGSSPDFALPEMKEPELLHAFSDPAACARAYARHFGDGATRLKGEASTTYTMIPWFEDVSCHALKVCGPGLKLVMIMRDPVDRIKSHLQHDYLTGRLKTGDFDREVFAHPRFLAISNYAMQLEKWVEVFGNENLICVDFSVFSADMQAEGERVAAFLGADPARIIASGKPSNDKTALVNPQHGAIKTAMRSNLYRNALRPLIPEVARRMGKAMLTKRRKGVEIVLSEATVTRIREELAPAYNHLEQITGFRLEKVG